MGLFRKRTTNTNHTDTAGKRGYKKDRTPEFYYGIYHDMKKDEEYEKASNNRNVEAYIRALLADYADPEEIASRAQKYAQENNLKCSSITVARVEHIAKARKNEHSTSHDDEER